MRFLLILSIFQLFASGVTAQTDSLRAYMRDLVVKNQYGSLTEDELTDLRAYGYALQNKALQFAETNKNDAEALSAADSALQFWISIGETGHEANVSKLKGTLLGKQGETEDARSCLLRSASLYESLQMGNGVAVAYYEMSVVLDQAGMTDSALWYQQQAAAYWLKQKETLKVVESNNQLIHLYRKLKRYEEGIKIQSATEKELTVEMHWRPVIDLYYVSYQLFRDAADQSKASLYLRLYNNWLNKLKEEGIVVISKYEK